MSCSFNIMLNLFQYLGEKLEYRNPKFETITNTRSTNDKNIFTF